MTVQAGIVTTQGVALLVASQIAGGALPIVSSVQICPTLMACTGDETEMDSVVFTVPSEALQASSPQSGTLRIGVVLDQTIGDFQIGTLGLFVGTTLFALATFPGAGSKIAASLPLVAGNIRTLYVDTAYVAVDGDSGQGAPIFTGTSALVNAIIFGG